jgi:hypothetical protein
VCTQNDTAYGIIINLLYLCACTAVLLFSGIAFSEQGFDSMMEYLYTGAVPGVTAAYMDISKVQASLVAAEFFGVGALARDAHEWAAICGVEIDCST